MRVYLACQDPPRAAIWALLRKSGMSVVGAADTTDEAVREGPDLTAEAVVLHASLPGALTSEDAILRLRAARPDVRVVVLLEEPDERLTEAVMRAGVFDFVVGDAVVTELSDRLEHPRTLADVIGPRVEFEEEPASSAALFGPARTLSVAFCLAEQAAKVLGAHLEEHFAGRVRVSRVVSSASELLQAVTDEVDGVVIGSGMLSTAPMGEDAYLRVLASLAQAVDAQVLMLFGPDDAPGLEDKAREASFLIGRGVRREDGRSGFPPDLFDKFVSRMEKRPAPVSEKAPLRGRSPFGRPARVTEERAAPAPPAPSEPRVVYEPNRTIATLSMSGGTGKSTLLANLAALAALLGMKVALVDCDPTNNSASDMFTDKVGTPLGLLRNEPDEAVTRRAVLDMGVSVPIGKGSVTLFRTRGRESAPVNLSLRLTQRIVEFVKSEYGVVFIDTHPLLILPSTHYAVMQGADVVYLVSTDSRDSLLHAYDGLKVLRRDAAAKGLGEPDIRLVVNRKTAGGLEEEQIRRVFDIPIAAIIPDGGDTFKAAMYRRRPLSLGERANGPWHALLSDALGDASVVAPKGALGGAFVSGLGVGLLARLFGKERSA